MKQLSTPGAPGKQPLKGVCVFSGRDRSHLGVTVVEDGWLDTNFHFLFN